MKYSKRYSRLLPSRTTTTEREESEFARVSATLDRLEKHRERVRSEFRDPVSVKYSYVDPYLEELESFANRLINENVAKQAEPDIVARNVNRINRELALAARQKPLVGRARPYVSKQFETAWVNSKRVDDSPRTIFGTEAYIKFSPRIGRRFMHSMHLNPRFVSRLLALPCVERRSRKEVLFATGRAGRGYRVSHRRSKFSDIWC